MTKHGSEQAVGNDAYPGVSVEDKRAFFDQFLQVMDGVVIDTSVTKINETTIKEMLERNHRLVPFVGDYVEFTDSSVHAVDGLLMDNNLGSSVDNEESAYASELSMFNDMENLRNIDKSQGKLFLRSMATSSPSAQVEALAYMKFDPFADSDEQTKACVESMNNPSLAYCPETLMDIAQMAVYYKQITLDQAYNDGKMFPNAIYIDALDYDGTLRTGTTLPWGVEKGDDVTEHKMTRYAYADTLVGYNVKLACKGREADADCVRLTKLIDERRAKYPLVRWDDAKYGRSSSWPV
jgi:hypothetical protein